jgi:alkylation response protein AidB-like acyl-CoA dehydrogenase
MNSRQSIIPNESSRTHFVFTDEHQQLRESISAFAQRELAPHAEEWEETTFPDSVFRRMGAIGLLGLDKPEEYGGQGGDYYSAIVLAEEIHHSRSCGLALGIAVQTDMAMPPIVEFGSEEQKQQWLVPAIAGEAILALGISEPDAGSDVSGIKTRAVRDGDGYIVNGSKTYVTNGHRADVIVLLAKSTAANGEEGFTLLLVPMDAPGVVRERRLEKLGHHASDTALLAFGDVRVPASTVLGEPGRGFQQIMWQLQGERLIAAASSLSAARLVFEDTLRYAQERHAFGRPIGSFQTTRHRFAEMGMRIESGRQMVYATAWRVANGDYPVREISMAKVLAAQTAFETVDRCLQIHGGAGYMKEYGIERVWRDLRLHRIGGGTDEILLDVIGRSYGL